MTKHVLQTSVEFTLSRGKSEVAVKIEGMRSLGGNDYFKFTYGNHVGYVRRDCFVVRKAEARSQLSSQGVQIISDAHWREMMSGIDEIGTFTPAPLIEQPGWTGPYFAQKHGKVYSPKGYPRGIPIFMKSNANDAARGRLADWKKDVAETLTGQTLPMVAVMAAFAAPLLALSGESQNIGVELCGRPASGKTTCLRITASVAGNPDHISNFNATQLGLESMFADYNDLPFPVDEANLISHGEGDFLKQFAFRMANGTTRVTAHQPRRAQHRFVFCTTSNRPFHEGMRSFDPDTADAALQRLLSLKVADDHPLGVFDLLPEGYASSGALASHIDAAIAKNYGRPMQRFLKALVRRRAEPTRNFEQELSAMVREFAVCVGVANSEQGKTRASTAFGLLYAAGELAKEARIVPVEWNCMAACIAAYRNYLAQLPHHTPLVARLLAIAQREQTLDLRGITFPRLSDEQVEQHGAFLVRGVRGRVELLLTGATQRQYFPDWGALQHTDPFKNINLRDKQHATKQRQVRRGRAKERFHCFVLPPDIVSLTIEPATVEPTLLSVDREGEG